MRKLSLYAHRVAVALVWAIYNAPWLIYRTIRGALIGVVAVCLCAYAVVETAKWEISLRLPGDSRDINDARERTSVTVLDSDGALLGVRGQRFQTVSVAEAGPLIVSAILAAEDRRFYWHSGVDPIGVVRALIINWRTGEIEQGGSSITQQVAKSFVGAEQTLERKIRELAFALALEARYDKDDILELYLNRAYLGAGAYGFRSAAKLYFGVELENVTAGQAALLAGLVRAPSEGFAGARARALSIVEGMYRSGVLTYEETLLAWVEVETIQPNSFPESASYYVDWVRDTVPPEVWELTNDAIVRTTLDLATQRIAETSIESVFAEHAGRDADAESAVVVISHDGAVRAMVGGRAYEPVTLEFNIAAYGTRQLGSAFKPFIYASAFEAGVSPGANVLDRPITLQTGSGPWSPRNYSRRYLGSIPIPVALARSSNVASVRLLQRAGLDRTIALARRAGFAGELPPYYPIALGTLDTNPLEVAGAYAIFNNGGRRVEPYAIVEITDRSGRVLWRREPPEPEQVIPARHAEWMVGLMRGVVEQGTGRRALFQDGRPAAGKTGTTQDYSDAWFAGFTGDYLAVVWVGYRDSRQPMVEKITGGNMPAMIWAEIMRPIHEGLPIAPLAESRFPPSYETIGDGPGVASNRRRRERAEASRDRERRREAAARERERRARERERRRDRRRRMRERFR